MSRHSHHRRRHPRHSRSTLLRQLVLFGLALPGTVVLALYLPPTSGGWWLMAPALALSALLAVGCFAWAAGRFAAEIFNFTSWCVGRAGLEKLMRDPPRPPRSRHGLAG
ncbi:MAG: hypothetical protein HZA93_04580 [Verrucomicrobia bacterium]|nr:hypothetical protein [Verrucomicrobiota bacterium]